jgi:hypothetical protein
MEKMKFTEWLKYKPVKLDWKNISNNDEVIKLIKEREIIDEKIKEIDEMAIVRYSIECLDKFGGYEIE